MRTHFLPLLGKCLWSRANLRHGLLLSGEVTDTNIDSKNILWATDQILNMTLSNAGLGSFPRLTVFKYMFFIYNVKY